MKFTVNVECTPEEARRFMGLPDVTPINETLVEEMGKRMEANLKLMSRETHDEFLDERRHAGAGRLREADDLRRQRRRGRHCST